MRVQGRGDGSQAVLRHISRADVVRFHRVSSSIFASVRASGVDVQEGADGQGAARLEALHLDDELEDADDEKLWLQNAAQLALLGCAEALPLLAERTSASARLSAVAAEVLSEAALRDLLRGPVDRLYPAAALLRNVAASNSAGGALTSRALRAHIKKVVHCGGPGSTPCPPLVLRELSAVLAAMTTAASAQGHGCSCGACKEMCNSAEYASFASTCVPDSSEDGDVDSRDLWQTLQAERIPWGQGLPAELEELDTLSDAVWEH